MPALLCFHSALLALHIVAGAMADARSSKLRKLNQFRRALPHVSASALASLLEEISDHGVPDLAQSCRAETVRKMLIEATALDMSAVTPYGPMLIDVYVEASDGSNVSMLVVNPLALIYVTFADGNSFTELMIDLLNKHACSPEQPWNLILYSDELVPGNVISHDNRRKSWIMYFSFLEFGPLLLSKEDAWFTCFSRRSSEVSNISAGISQAFAAVIKLFFGALTTNLSTGGMTLQYNGKTYRLFAKLGMILQDGAAHKLTFGCKGDAGTRLCMLCRTLVSVKSNLVDEDGQELLTCSLVQESEMDMATDEDIKGSLSRLVEKHDTCTRAAFLLREQAIGFVYQPKGLLMDTSLESIVHPVSQYCHDWMHALMVNGVFNTVVYLVTTALLASGCPVYSLMFDYINTWKWPARVANNHLNAVFSKKRLDSNKRAKTFKATASEGLSFFAVFAVWLMAVVRPGGECGRECLAFLALCDLLELLIAVPLGIVSPHALRIAVAKLLDLCVEAGWKQYLHPKFHWLVHFAGHLEKFGCLPTCWVHERKHRVAKRYANEILNTRCWERSLLSEITNHHWANLQDNDTFNLQIGLVQPQKASAKLLDFFSAVVGSPVSATDCCTSSVARIVHGSTISKKDVVLIKSEDNLSFLAGEVWLTAEVHGVPVTLVSLWLPISYDKAACWAKWQQDSNPQLVETSDIMTAVQHTELGNGVVKTLIPLFMRQYKQVCSAA